MNKFDEALELFKNAIVEDYRSFNEQLGYDTDEKVKRFADGIEFKVGKKYIKVIRNDGQKSVHSFIVREDGPKFKKGDILKAASWSAPATNKARGNIFESYYVRWTGAEYLK